MNAIVAKAIEISKKFWYLALQYSYVSLHWMLKEAKIQGQKWSRCSARKELEKSNSALGTELFSLFKLGEEAEWQKQPAIRQHLIRVEESEAKVFQVDAAIDQIRKDFTAKKEQLRAEYTAKREAASSPPAGECRL
jgi:hypothetical protein